MFRCDRQSLLFTEVLGVRITTPIYVHVQKESCFLCTSTPPVLVTAVYYCCCMTLRTQRSVRVCLLYEFSFEFRSLVEQRKLTAVRYAETRTHVSFLHMIARCTPPPQDRVVAESPEDFLNYHDGQWKSRGHGILCFGHHFCLHGPCGRELPSGELAGV